jgi:putative endonuclease
MSSVSSIWQRLAARFRTKPKSLGERGEDAAARYLKRQGLRILKRGHNSRLGEIDIIAIDDRTVVFVEVKTRSSNAAGRPEDSIDAFKQRRMTQSALAYLKSNRLLQSAARFDVVAVTWTDESGEPQIKHYRSAFEAKGAGQLYS